MAFSYYSPISINAAQVPSTQTDFPVLVSVTDARFKTVSNGGHVTSPNGYDIRPYTDTTLGTAITGYELERFVATTGELIMWVKVASLSSSTTPIVLAYGDSSVTTNDSSTTTWSNSFLGVYHFKDGTTLDVNSATGSNNGTNVGTVTAATGKIDGAASLGSITGFGQRIEIGNSINPAAITWSAWINPSSFPNAYNAVEGRINAPGTSYSFIYVKSTGNVAWYVKASADVFVDPGAATLLTGTWYHVVMTYDSSSGLVGYINGSVDASAVANGALTTLASDSAVGTDLGTTSRYWSGLIDEARVASVVRSANWVTTEYNNQSAPGTFETLGAESSSGGGGVNSGFLMFM